MKFDFEKIINRKNMESKSYDSLDKPGNPTTPKNGFEIIPMFVSDMDFAIAPSIQDAIHNRTKHPIYGYFDTPDYFYQSIINWHEKRKNVSDLKNEYIGYQNDVLGGLVSSLKVLNKEGDPILLHAPTFSGFVDIINSLGYKAILSDLIEDENGIFRMDYDDMDKKIEENNIKTLIFCSPHNPIGRVWEIEELKRLSKVVEKHSVKIISDEIWSDIILNDNIHTPTQNGSEYLKNNTIALYSPSKGFNLAGLNLSYHIIYDKELRDEVTKSSSMTYYNMPNILSLHALKGAYSKEGLEWLEELNNVLSDNINFTYDFIKSNIKNVEIQKPQGTYIVFMDVEKWIKEHNMNMDELLQKGYDYGIGWSDGRPFNSPYGIRLNLALPRKKFEEALDRMVKYIF